MGCMIQAWMLAGARDFSLQNAWTGTYGPCTLLFGGYQGVLLQGLGGQDVRLTTCVPLTAEDKK